MFCFGFPRKSLKTFMLFVGLSSFKGTTTCIPTLCAWDNRDSCMPRIENRYSKTQPVWLHSIHNIHVLADSCKFYFKYWSFWWNCMLIMDSRLIKEKNSKTVGFGYKRTRWSRTLYRFMLNSRFFRPFWCYRSRRNDWWFIIDVPWIHTGLSIFNRFQDHDLVWPV